jgi:hypothetical protein
VGDKNRYYNVIMSFIAEELKSLSTRVYHETVFHPVATTETKHLYYKELRSQIIRPTVKPMMLILYICTYVCLRTYNDTKYGTR